MARRKRNKLLGSYPISFSWRESYPSIILGIVVLAVVGILVYNFSTSVKKQSTVSETPKTQVEESNQLPTHYQVVKGDSLTKIAEKFYNDPNKWIVIAKENKLANPSLIHAGNVFVIPKLESVVTQAAAESSPTNPSKPKEYTVKRGDTLWEIAEAVYGNGSAWTKIFEANHLSRLPNGNPLIHVGNVLVIPD